MILFVLRRHVFKSLDLSWVSNCSPTQCFCIDKTKIHQITSTSHLHRFIGKLKVIKQEKHSILNIKTQNNHVATIDMSLRTLSREGVSLVREGVPLLLIPTNMYIEFILNFMYAIKSQQLTSPSYLALHFHGNKF